MAKGNKKIIVERLEELLINALKVAKKRRPTKPGKGAIEKRLKVKKINSEKKKRRNEDF